MSSPALIPPTFILVETQLADNIGSAARAMLNFGLDRMRLVNPKPEWPSDRAIALASGADRVLREAKVCRSLGEAVSDLQVVYATSARPRDLVRRIITPEQAGREMRAHAANGVRCGVLFGPERMGLVNDDLASVDAVITAPVNPDYGSINLAQAVLLIAYEWVRTGSDLAPSVLRTGDSPIASRQHLQSFLDRLVSELDESGFLRVSHMRPAMIRNIHALFSRTQLTDQEVRTLHGILTELVNIRLTRRPRPE